MTLIYATRSVLPSSTANSVQSAHMACELEAISTGAFIALYRTRAPDAAPNAHFTPYGVSPPSLAVALPARVPALDCLSADVLSAALFFRKQPAATTLVYTRSLRYAAAAVATGLRTCVELHDPLTAPRTLLLRRLLATGRLQGVVSTTTRLRDDLFSALPALPPTRVLVAGNGAPSTTVDCPSLPLPAPGAFNVGYAGSAFRGKGVEIILACAALLPSFAFHIIGPDRQACARFGKVPPNVVFTGRRPQPEVLGLLKSMNALLLPNQRSVIIRSGADIGQHTSPLKLFEYLATGRPVVASDLPVFNGILHDGENALLAAPESPAAFARQLRRLRDDPALSARLGARGQRDFVENHTWTRRAERIHNFMTNNSA